MSLFSTMRTSVSGMAAQSNALSTIGDNIANSSTTGYKAASAQFETILGQNSSGSYESGGVQTDVRYGITEQGTLATTTSSTDLAVNGSGFFVVSKGGTGTYLTRAGSFVPDSTGNLINSAGFQLMGYQVLPDGTTSSTLTPVNVAPAGLQYAISTTGTFTANLNSTATTVTPGPATAGTPADPTTTPPTAAVPATPQIDLPSSNLSTSTYTSKTSITLYDNLGTPEVMDVYLTKTDDNTWEAVAYPKSDASASGGFPYMDASGNTDSPAGQTTMTFDPATGAITGGTSLSVSMASGNVVSIDTSGMTQLATSFGVTTATANGNAPSKVSSVSVAKDGTVTDVYASGVQVKTFEVPIATVASPDNLTPLSGNVYVTSEGSGDMILSQAGTNGAGAIDSDTLEQSNVDLASELTNMIVAQRSYEANSKVLQAGSDLLGVLNRLTTN